MPTYLDFDTTKTFRDFILSKTLSVPNGPKTFNAGTYSNQHLSDLPNIDQGAIDANNPSYLTQSQTSNIYKPLTYFVKDTLETLPRRANLSLYPAFEKGIDHTFIGIMNSDNLQFESELMKFAAYNIKSNPEGPFFGRVSQNLFTATTGRINLIDALQGNTATALNLITGRQPLIDPNQKITVDASLVGKGIDFLATVTGVEYPFARIPGDYLSNPKNPIIIRPTSATQAGAIIQDLTGAVGSLVGIQRRPTVTRKPSDLFIEYMGSGSKATLYDNLTYSKYAPNYTTTARSQNTSKVFTFVDQFAQSVKNFLGVEAPAGISYMGDDRGNDVKNATIDANDRPVKSSYYLSLMFDPIQATLFEGQKSIGEGGGIAGKLTWISTNSRNKLGVNNTEFTSEESQFSPTLSTNATFRDGSILGQTQEILNSLPTTGLPARSHVANVIDQTSRVFREGTQMMSRGSNIKYVDKFTGLESGIEYCRVWTKDRSYMNYSDTMKKTTLSRKFGSSVLSTPWNLNIYPNSNGNQDFNGSTNIAKGMGDGFYAKKYMFSIENLAWRSSNTPGFTYNDLPYCERGPNGGRIMWFPPYDFKVDEQNSAKWEENVFLGRPEPVYTYQNTTRSGNVKFKVIVDHPSILNLMVKSLFKDMSDDESNNYINAFFAGCQDIDFYGLIRKFTTLSQDDLTKIQSYLNGNKDPNTIKMYKAKITPAVDPVTPPTNEIKTQTFKTTLFFKNDFPTIGKGKLYAAEDYQTLFTEYKNFQPTYMSRLATGLATVTAAGWTPTQQINYNALTYAIVPNRPLQTVLDATAALATEYINQGFDKLTDNYKKFSDTLETIKIGLSGKTVQNIKLRLGSRTSSIADEKYNLDLSYRRSYSIITDIINKIANTPGNATTALNRVVWKGPTTSQVKNAESGISINLKSDLGYDVDGTFVIEYVENIGEQPAGSPQSGVSTIDCSDKYKIIGTTELKQTAPITFFCRETDVTLSYESKAADQPAPAVPVAKPTLVEETDTPTRIQTTPPIDEMKMIIMKTLSECFYFKKLEEESPLQFASLKEKLRYFHPAFHSMTPEGLNARLTFLQQCIRPGETLPIKGVSDVSDLNARNTTFGPPPVCVMRIGDFYHSKIIIRDVNIDFEDNIWDLNPEGIGVQPMIANVTLNVNFIGGHGLAKPVERLQNALSSNFYANTEIYDPRSISTETTIAGQDVAKFTKEFLEDIVKNNTGQVNKTSQDAPSTPVNVTQGQFLGKADKLVFGIPTELTYTSLVQDVFDQVNNYFVNFTDPNGAYNNIVAAYGLKIGALLMSPAYRTINTYTVKIPASSDQVTLFGNYPKGKELVPLTNIFKTQIQGLIKTTNISELFKFNKELSGKTLKKSEELLNPIVYKIIGDVVDGLTRTSVGIIEGNRDKIIVTLDKLNFLVDVGHDGSLNGTTAIGVTITGGTLSDMYVKYASVISYIKTNQSKLTEDLDTSFVFSAATVMTENDLSYFLSELLKTKKDNIMEIYKDKTYFTDKEFTALGKRLDRFLATAQKPKNFKLDKFPIKIDTNPVSFKISDFTYLFSVPELANLNGVFKTSGNKTTTILNYYRNG